jgi:probable rRNA maturation factor
MTIPLDLTIIIENPRWESVLPSYESLINNAVGTTLHAAQVGTQHKEASIVLADDHFVQENNRQFRNKDKPTNVLSFPADKAQLAAGNLGDIMLSLETLEREALEQKKNFKDHVTHMLVHGVLHLLNYNHITDEDAHVMESLEIKILESLGIANPYEHRT